VGGEPGPLRTAGFGWEVVTLHNNGADVSFEVRADVLLRWLDFDAAYMVTAPPPHPGFAEVLFTVGCSAGPPSFSARPQAYQVLSPSPGFGPVQSHNPEGLQVVYDGAPGQGLPAVALFHR
jgi:hypothetical protein